MNQLIRTWIHRYFSNPQMAILWLLLIVGFALVLLLGEMLAPVLAAIVIAYLLEGVNSLLIRRRVPRTAAVLIDTLSAPASSSLRMSSVVRTPPPTVSGMKHCSAVPRTTS